MGKALGKNRNAKLLGFALTVMLTFLTATTASAAIVGYVTVDSNGTHYEYDFDALLKSYAKQLLGSPSPLFSDYNKKNMYTFVDDQNGYIDYDDVVKAYARAMLNNKSFDPDKYTASNEAQKALMPAEIFVVSLGSDGKVKYTKKVLELAVDFMAALNEIENAAELESLLTSQGADVGLDLSAFNKLNSDQKTEALNGVFAKRPAAGFDSLMQFKNLFDGVVAALAPTPADALKAVNKAADTAAMKKTLQDYDNLLELYLSRYNLTVGEMDSLAGRLTQLRPFASVKELQRFLHISFIAIRNGFIINHIGYNYTLTWMLDKQMTVNPQTDTYGGGWKNAKRADVQFYIDPYNFVNMDYAGSQTESIRILAESNLRLRERPTTQSNQVVDADGKGISVKYNEICAILDRAEAETGTEEGTEGIWYRIKASGKEGWVCGKFCAVVGDSYTDPMLLQFMRLSGTAGSTAKVLNEKLEGKGTLHGMGAVFMEASQENNTNEIFLVSMALHETGNGTSVLAQGHDFEDKDNLFPGQKTVKVYNMFGIGAYDSNPYYEGAKFAYEKGWFTPEEAIKGGVEFIFGNYIKEHLQDTLYKMRWNPGSPTSHQYATDMGWAAKQVRRISGIYSLMDNCTLIFDIPRYQE